MQDDQVPELTISDEQGIAVAAVAALVEIAFSDQKEIAFANLDALMSRIGQRRREIVPATSPVLGRLLASTLTALSATLPDCPHAPTGSSVSLVWDPNLPGYGLMLQCQHDPPHCWDTHGTSRSC